ncbi:effector-associated constant component EACC1 [Streptomyces tanashiensis]|uniref:effector-associated constant component EACC1 n=1 Tax=Streptomyces tanashiensis TaxID=67367 RepID=UPI0033C79D0A
MRVRIESDGDKLALTELQGWLARDPKARQLSVVPVSTPGPTMGAMDALDIVLGTAGDIANFAVGYAGWRLARARGGNRGARTLVFGGATVDIGHLDPQQLAELLRGLEAGNTEAGNAEAGNTNDDASAS